MFGALFLTLVQAISSAIQKGFKFSVNALVQRETKLKSIFNQSAIRELYAQRACTFVLPAKQSGGRI